MNQRYVFSPVTLIFSSILFLLFPAAVAAEGCLNASCHQELTQVRYLHGPVAAELAGVDGCVMCHVPSGSSCTATRAGKFTIKQKDICFICHEKGAGTQHTESEVESKCLYCHVPHGSDLSPQMLRKK
jgi:predicted CXXCH cytochrome family protein